MREIDNPIIREERIPLEPHYAPCYEGIELISQAERDAANKRMREENLARLDAEREANKRGKSETHPKAS